MRRLRGHRTVALALALALVGVPTFAGLFPGFIFRTQRWERIVVMLAWLGAAFFVTVTSQSKESEAHALNRASHRMLLKQYLSLLLGPQSLIPAVYRPCVYIASGSDVLLPWWPHQTDDLNDPMVFRKGQGATGGAFATGEPVVVVGDAVSSNEYGLTPAQQEYFACGAVVVAVPIRRPDDQIVGVLSVLAETNDGFFASSNVPPAEAEVDDARVQVLEDLADDIGRALSDEGVEVG